MKKYLRSAIVGLIAVFLCTSPVWLYFWFRIGVVKPYNTFRREEVEAIPEFDRLNKNVANILPPPPEGVSLVKESSSGIEAPVGLHGRYLYLFFEKSTPTIANEISTYYRTYLLDHGWSEVNFNISSDAYLDRYFLNTSCIEIRTSNTDITGKYKITIWHDFKNQSFSPPVPNELFMGFFEVGKTLIVECPWRPP